MLKLCRTADAAREQGRNAFDGECVIEGVHRSSLGFLGPLDGAHIFSAKMAPEIAAAPLNILPICRYRHNNPFGFYQGDEKGCMDLVGLDPKPPLERIEWVLRWVNGDYRQRVREQILELVYEALLVSERVKKLEDDLTAMLYQ